MCGIAGVFWATEPAFDARQAAWIARRGPDGQGEWTREDGRVRLEHVRLAIIDPSDAGRQPMMSHDQNVVMAFNGEIYNFRELRRELEAEGVRFFGHSDSEVLLALFCRHGIEAMRRLNGIFAVAFWEQDTQRLWLMRDGQGVKPLYFTQRSDGFAFCSEIKGLLRSGLVVPKLNPRAVLSHLSLLWSAGQETIVAEVEKLAPGEAVCVERGRITARQMVVMPLYQSDELAALSDVDAVRAVASGVETAVRRQMVADVPVGAFLSGGLDSSAVVAFAVREAIAARLQCFTIRLEAGSSRAEGFADDLPYARRVAKHLGVDLHEVSVGDEMIDRLAEMIYLLDEPTPDPAALNTLFIAELARESGMKVLLSGAGGDDIFTGYRRHYALTQEQWWDWLPRPLRAGLGHAAQALPARPASLRRAGKAFRYAGLSADQRLATYFMWASPDDAFNLLSPVFRAELAAAAVAEPLMATLAALPTGLSPLRKMLALEQRHFLADHNLHYTDKMGMAAGVEVRVPLLDPDLVKLASSLSDNQKQRGRVGKWVFKKAMEPYLPSDVIYRPKTGFGVPLRRWLHGRLRPMIDEALSPLSLRSRGVFSPEAVAALLADDRAGRVDAGYTILGMVCIELWCRQHLDGAYVIS